MQNIKYKMDELMKRIMHSFSIGMAFGIGTSKMQCSAFYVILGYAACVSLVHMLIRARKKKDPTSLSLLANPWFSLFAYLYTLEHFLLQYAIGGYKEDVAMSKLGSFLLLLGTLVNFISVVQKTDRDIETDGIYSVLRYPAEGSFFVILLGATLAVGNYVTLFAVIYYYALLFVPKIRKQQRAQMASEEYVKYISNTPSCLPLVP